MKPYSVCADGIVQFSLVAGELGPPYTDISTGYFRLGVKVEGKLIMPRRGVLPSAARYVNSSTFFSPSCSNFVRLLRASSASTLPFASSTRVNGATSCACATSTKCFASGARVTTCV